LSVESTAIVLALVLVAVLLTGLPIGASMFLVAMAGMLFFTPQPLFSIGSQAWYVSNSFTLTALPLFIFMGQLFSETGIADKLFWAVDRWLGWLPGGIAASVIGASAVFAAISGSSVAGAATMGSVVLDPMKERRYNRGLTLAVVAAGGTLGILIPPSIIMIVYGSFRGLSVGRLFAAGMIPGILLAAGFLVTLFVILKVRPTWAPAAQHYTWRQRMAALLDLIPSVIVIAIVLGGVFGGIMTPTEAAGVGCAGVALSAIVYRKLTRDTLKRAISQAARTTAMVMFVVIAAQGLAFLMHYLGLGAALGGTLLGLGLGRYGVLAVIVIFYLTLGMFFEGISIMVITIPVVVPIVTGVGFSEYWFAVPLVIMIEAALLTPPVGLNLYVLNSLAPDADILSIAKSCTPFYIPMLLTVVLVVAYPEVVLWLPRLIYG
jgi:tripartite ATP-independent transporter DctM subunit